MDNDFDCNTLERIATCYKNNLAGNGGIKRNNLRGGYGTPGRRRLTAWQMFIKMARKKKDMRSFSDLSSDYSRLSKAQRDNLESMANKVWSKSNSRSGSKKTKTKKKKTNKKKGGKKAKGAWINNDLSN